MPAKIISPEAAQNRERKAEIRELEKARRHVLKSFDAEIREANHEHTLKYKELKAALKALAKIEKAEAKAADKFGRITRKLGSAKARDLGQIDRRIAILKGRVGAG